MSRIEGGNGKVSARFPLFMEGSQMVKLAINIEKELDRCKHSLRLSATWLQVEGKPRKVANKHQRRKCSPSTDKNVLSIKPYFIELIFYQVQPSSNSTKLG